MEKFIVIVSIVALTDLVLWFPTVWLLNRGLRCDGKKIVGTDFLIIGAVAFVMFVPALSYYLFFASKSDEQVPQKDREEQSH